MKLYKLIASGLGTGYAPIAPGTFGSLLGVFLIYAVNRLINNSIYDNLDIILINISFFVLVFILGVISIRKVHRIWQHDSSKIVIDEIAGIWIALLGVPLNWKLYLAGFVIFRLFDILKPFGIKKLDDLNSELSVMLDDILAGIYSLGVLQFILLFI